MVLERLVQPFQRMAPDRTRHSAGAGLGLSIVQAIAAAHGAAVTATSRSEGGLRVEVGFPPVPGATPARARPIRTRPAIPPVSRR